MSIPVAESYSTANDTARTSTTLALPYATGIEVNDVLIAFVTDYTTTAPTFPAGWTEIWSDSCTDNSRSVAGACYWRLADGTESGNVSVTVTTNGCAGIMWRVSGCANPNLEPPIYHTNELYNDIVAVGFSSFGNSVPSMYPIYDSGDEILKLDTEDYLSFAMCCQETVGVYKTLDSYPEDYAQVTNVGQTGSSQLWMGHRDVTAPMETTDNWNFSGSADISTIYGLVLLKGRQRTVHSSTHPYVRSMATTTEEGRITNTTYKQNLPPTIHKGDIVVCFIAQHDTQGPAVTWPDGWTELYDTNATSSGGGSYTSQSCAYKKADGSEGTTITLPVVAESQTCGFSFSIGGCEDTDSYPPEYVQDSGNVGDCDPITPSYGSGNYLFMCVTSNVSTGVNYTAPSFNPQTWVSQWPTTDYLSRCMTDSNDELFASNNVTMFAAWKQATGTTDSPGGFSFLPVKQIACTITLAFYGGTFDPGDWWYLNWRGKGRNGFQ